MTIAALLMAVLFQTVTAARVSNVAGEAEINRPTETTLARNGDPVSDGDRLHTLKNASLSLATESGVTLQLKSDTRLEMKKISGEVLASLVEGGVGVTSMGKPVRIETKYGQIIGVDDTQEFEVRYSGNVIQVLVIRGSVTAEASEPSKILFKNAADLGVRVYEAGSISPTEPRVPGETTVIVYPQIGNSTPRVIGPNRKRPTLNPPIVLPK